MHRGASRWAVISLLLVSWAPACGPAGQVADRAPTRGEATQPTPALLEGVAPSRLAELNVSKAVPLALAPSALTHDRITRIKDGVTQVHIEVVRKKGLVSARSCLDGLSMDVDYEAGLYAVGWVAESGITSLSKTPCLASVRVVSQAQTFGIQTPRSAYPGTPTGRITNQALIAQSIDTVRERYKLDGSGVEVCIISSSFDLLGGMEAAVASGELPGPGNPNYPQPVNIALEGVRGLFPGVSIDEGRAMAELIHDIAPGARLSFAGITAGDSRLTIVRALEALRASAKCDVIVDDIAQLDISAVYQDDLATRAIEDAARAGILYVTAAGNSGLGGGEPGVAAQYLESAFRPVPLFGGLFHDFDPDPNSVAPLVPLTPGEVPARASQDPRFVRAWLQWDAPWGSLCVECRDRDSRLQMVVFRLTSDNELSIYRFSGELTSQDPVAGLLETLPNDGAEYLLGIFARNDEERLPERLWLSYYSPGLRLPGVSFDAPTIWSKGNASSAITVGSSSWFNTPRGAKLWNETFAGRPVGNVFVESAVVPERPVLSYLGAPSYLTRNMDASLIATPSSYGGGAIYYDLLGNRLPQPDVRNKPDLVGADGVQTTFFALRVRDLDDAYFFFGTSSAAPNVGAVVALMLQASNGTLSLDQAKRILTETAIDMDDPFDRGFQGTIADPAFSAGFDFGSGHGFVDPVAAIEKVVAMQERQPVTLEPVCENQDGTHVWQVSNENGFAVPLTFYSTSSIMFPFEHPSRNEGPTWLVPPGISTIATTPVTSSERLLVLGEGIYGSYRKRGGWSPCTAGDMAGL